MRIASITNDSYVDGPGRRTVVHVAGCSIRCPGCQNKHLWPKGSGYAITNLALATTLYGTGQPITITGGEPFDQPRDLYAVLEALRCFDPADRHIIVYSGYTLEELAHTRDYYVLASLAMIDVLVDGPYVRELDAPDMQYRGSSNQRVIDLPATFEQPVGITFSRGPVELDWDTPEIILTDEGNLLAASPLAREYAEAGTLESARRCGETCTN